MHFKNHQEYLRFVRSTPVEPKEYQPVAAEEPEEPAEEEQKETVSRRGRKRRDG